MRETERLARCGTGWRVRALVLSGAMVAALLMLATADAAAPQFKAAKRVNFGRQAVSTTTAMTWTVTNNTTVTRFPGYGFYGGGIPEIVLTDRGDCADFTLEAGASCTFTFEFTPSSAGKFSALFTFDDGDGGKFLDLAVDLVGTGV